MTLAYIVKMTCRKTLQIIMNKSKVNQGEICMF